MNPSLIISTQLTTPHHTFYPSHSVLSKQSTIISQVLTPTPLRLQGYLKGYRPPGRCSDTSICNGTANPSTEPYYVAHIMLLAHLVTAKEYRLTYQVQRDRVGDKKLRMGEVLGREWGEMSGLVWELRCLSVYIAVIDIRCRRGWLWSFARVRTRTLQLQVSESVHTFMLQEEMGGVVGITVNADYYYPLTDSAEDKEAAERALIYKLGW